MYDDMWWRLLVILSWLIELLYTHNEMHPA